VWHAPDATLFGRLTPNTVQIGQPDVIAARLGVPVIADFRTRDMVYGGQGAPLVPIVDWLLLRSEAEHRVALNLGGMANITVLPAGGAPESIQAFDTGPANALIDLAVQQGTDGAQTYDGDGALAETGTVHRLLLEWLMGHPYLQQSPPKSTGREVFGEALLGAIQAQFGEFPLPDLVATLTEFTAASVADALQRFVLPQYPVQRIIASGGGVHNRTLMARLQALLPDIIIESSAQHGIDPDFKEAVAFAVLADRFLQGLPATYPNTTGVRQPALAGKLALP
jgi:anhydro-N-acetylmuramic acid kinase